jgi:hypothetical protein
VLDDALTPSASGVPGVDQQKKVSEENLP